MSFPPLEFSFLAWIAWVPLLLSLQSCKKSQAFWQGLIAGLVFWVLTLSWLGTLSETGCDLPTAVGAWLMLSCYAALYVGLFALLTSCIFSRTGPVLGWLGAGVVACVWVALEYGRLTLATGFPWNPMGVCQFRNLPLIQWAAVGGVPLVSWIILYVNAALVLCIRSRSAKERYLHGLTIVGILSLSLLGGRWLLDRPVSMASTEMQRIAVLNPGLAQLKKWSEDSASENLSRLAALGATVTNQRAALVVLPETTLPGLPGYDPETDAFIAVFPVLMNCLTLLGAVELEIRADGSEAYFNSALLLDRGGQIVDRYRKTHLVPFGEYIPLVDRFPIMNKVMPVGFFSCVAGTNLTVFHDTGAEGISPLICFEDTISDLSRRAARQGATRLVFITNDAWYPHTSASLQHLSQCVFRCIETGLWGIRSANMGATGFISPNGRLDMMDESGLTAGAHIRDVPLTRQGRVTPYVLYGDRCWAWPCVLVSCVACIVMWVGRKMRAL